MHTFPVYHFQKINVKAFKYFIVFNNVQAPGHSCHFLNVNSHFLFIPHILLQKNEWLVVSAHQQEDYIHKQKFPECVTVHHHIY